MSGGGVVKNKYSDGVFTIEDNAQATKQLMFEVSAISPNTTRYLIMPDADVNLGSGGSFQPYSANLTDIAALTPTLDNIIVGDGANWVQESGATARSSLGLGTISTQDASNVAITGGSITGITDLAVADGGTGKSSFTPYSIICGGTSATSALQNVISIGTAGQALVSNGPNLLPTFQTISTFTWNEVTGTSQSASVNNGYICNNASLVTVTLPTTAAVGDIIEIVGKGAGAFKIAQNASQVIYFNNTNTTTGTGGSITAINQYSALSLICITANTTFVVKSSLGTFQIV